MLRVRNTSRTRPLALCMWKRVAFRGDDAGRVLAAMLEHQQPVVEQLVDRRLRDDSENSAHGADSFGCRAWSGVGVPHHLNFTYFARPSGRKLRAKTPRLSTVGRGPRFCQASALRHAGEPAGKHQQGHDQKAARETE